MTREEIIDELELYTIGRPKKDRVFITVEELQKFIDEIQALEQEPITIHEIPKDYKYDTETKDFLVYRNMYTGKEIHIECPTPVYKLEQELCEDAISRQVVLDTIDSYMSHHMGLLDLKLFVTELSSVKPKEPCEDIIIDEHYWKGFNNGIRTEKFRESKRQEPILDKIRAEIENFEINGHIRDVECFNAGIRHALIVIDKYKAESEDKK